MFISVLCLNVGGIKLEENRTAKISALLKDNREIICIQELRLTSQEDMGK